MRQTGESGFSGGEFEQVGRDRHDDNRVRLGFKNVAEKCVTWVNCELDW